MFGMFGSGKIKAQCMGDSLSPMNQYAGLNLNKLKGKENFELQEDAFKMLEDCIGQQKKYHSLEMVCATWLALINSVSKDPSHTFSEQKLDLEKGFTDFLSVYVDEVVKDGMPSKLFSLLKKYL